MAVGRLGGLAEVGAADQAEAALADSAAAHPAAAVRAEAGDELVSWFFSQSVFRFGRIG